MTRNFVLAAIFLISFTMLISCGQNNESRFSELKGPYLGQKPPGIKAEIFAPGLISAGENELHITFSPDGMEFSYTIYTTVERILVEPTGPFKKLFVMYSNMEEGHWTEPKEFSFNPARSERFPFFSPDGKRIFFNSTRNLTDPSDKSNTCIWYVERKNGEWSGPKEIDFGEDYQGGDGVFPTVAANGNLYFSLWPDGENGIIYMSRYENGKYSSPERLSDAINDRNQNHPYIAPDENYIIFDSERTENNYGETDIFISFRDKNGKWKKAQNLGKAVNSRYDDARPFVTFDGKYLFFASDRIENTYIPNQPLTLKELQQLTNVPENGNQHIYWVDAKVIEELRPKN